MMEEKAWIEAFDKEILQAESARKAGNEGKARVCARRAAGILAGQFLRQNGIEPKGASALDYLEQVRHLEILDERIRSVIGLFLRRVDETGNLPDEVDLLVQAGWLRKVLMKA